MKKRNWISMILTACLLFTAVPASVSAETSEHYTEKDVSGVRCTIISDSTRAAYVNKMMKYHLLSSTDNYRVERNLKNGDSVVFFFDGCSDNVKDSTYSDYTKYRLSAYCAVVQEVDGKPTVVFESENCSTIPDNPRNPDTNEGTPVPTVRDGVYNILSTNHGGYYAALRMQDNSGSVPVVRGSENDHYISTSSAINIHARSQFKNAPTDGITPTSYSSAGCFIVGKVSDNFKEYNAFIKAVLGVSSARGNSHNNMVSPTFVDHGIVIVDRTNYRKELEAIYGGDKNGTAAEVIAKLTAYTDELLKTIPDETGDVNGDGKKNTADYVLLKRHVMKTYTLSEKQQSAADMNSDGKINTADYVVLKKQILNQGK